MDNVKDKITKLLAMAKDGRGNEHEAEIAMRMAERLMRQHDIDVADLEASTGKQTVYSWRSVNIPVGELGKLCNRCPMWAGFLGVGVAQFTDCKASWVDDAEYLRCMRFDGNETDIEYSAWLFKMLRDFGYAESKSVGGRHRETFRKAFAIRLCERMRTLRMERDEALRQAVTKTGTALIAVENKIALRDAEFGKQRVRKQRTTFASEGFREGSSAADRVKLNRPIGHAR